MGYGAGREGGGRIINTDNSLKVRRRGEGGVLVKQAEAEGRGDIDCVTEIYCSVANSRRDSDLFYGF